MKKIPQATRVFPGDIGLERIKHFQELLSRAPVNSDKRRELTAAIHIEAQAYRKSLDTEQARGIRSRSMR